MNTQQFLLVAIALVIAFLAGYYLKSWIYKDLCLDLGGGQYPDNYPICVIEK